MSESGRNGLKKRKPWPKDCPWPEPLWDGIGGLSWEEDLIDDSTVDEDVRELLQIKEYFDRLVEEGRLYEDYSLNEDYDIEKYRGFEENNDNSLEGDHDDSYEGLDDEDLYDDDPEDTKWTPEIGEDYWDDGFDFEGWEEDLSDHMNLLKITPCQPDPIAFIRETIGYEFINENLLRQAFTRRAFQIEYGLGGCSEELEFLGDSVMNHIVTREIISQLAWVVPTDPDAPFTMKRKDYKEGELSRLRVHFTSKEYLAARAGELGLGQWILYGTGEQENESSLEDALEALIGAVAIDSDWDWDILENVVDKLLCIQLSRPDELLQKTYYDLFNSWHQRHFGCIPEYEIYHTRSKGKTPGEFECSIRFSVPENEKKIHTVQSQTGWGDTRSRARELAAEFAYRFVCIHGLWINLKDAGVIPDLDRSINQLQELFQKGYVDRPVYEFQEEPGDKWYCSCRCSDISGHGSAGNKTAAKKKAAYMVLVLLLKSAGCAEEEWLNQMYGNSL